MTGRTLAHYTIKAAIGAGGMGEVYRAADARLGRDVALKVLPADVAGDRERLARFQREARAVAALNHPNIVTIYSVEEADGVHFFTMELVQGQSLDRLIAGGGLPVERTIEIGSTLADALAVAHDRGIVHRDLKPANIMVRDDGWVKVLDFGLAKETRHASPEAGTMTSPGTEAGVVLGTPAYMSPEQVAGRPIDARTDIYALGAVLYEMATGRRAFESDSAAGLMAAILRDAPPSASSVRAGLPPALVRAIEDCLRKDPAERPQAARDLRARLASAIGSGPAPVAGADDRSIAVLPLASLTADPNDDLFADGMTEEILNALAQIPGLRVAGRRSAFSFKGKSEDLRSVGAKLNVATILEGTLRRSGDRLRITVQLIHAGTGYQVWSERYDRVMADVFAVQDEIASAIAGRLRVSLGSGPGAGADDERRPPRDLAAYELYLRGRALLYQRGLSIPRAIECFREAVRLDPDYAQAWAGLADGYTTSGYSGLRPPGEVMPRALEAARRALALGPNLAEAHNAVACASLIYDRDYDGAERAFRRALELAPNYAQARAWYGLFFLLWVSGREADARAEIGRLLALDPLSGYAHAILGFADVTTGRLAEAVVHASRAVELDPESYLARWCLALSLAAAGRPEDALAAVERGLAMSGRHQWALSTLVRIYANWGKPDRARAAWHELESRAATEYVQPSMLAPAAAAVGEMDRAIDYVRQAVDLPDPMFVLLARTFPEYSALRADARFFEIVARLGLPGGGA